ncbi:MAG: cupin domain-containing protein [Pseudomonadota bacterium]|nr:cupin domain-containing protein [Pseudomonadota bacterium]
MNPETTSEPVQQKPQTKAPALTATAVAAVRGQTIYPAPFSDVVKGRLRRRLGEQFGLANFGVNLTEIAPGTASALAHHHTKQDEFVYVLQGTLTLMLDGEALTLHAGDCYGFKAGNGIAHQLVNESDTPAIYLEVGDRSAGDDVTYPYDDLKLGKHADGSWQPLHKDGTPY